MTKSKIFLLAVLLGFGCSSKPSREALERARELRVAQIRAAMHQTESQIHAAEMRIAEAKRIRRATEREAEIAAGLRETNQYLLQKKALQAELSAVMMAMSAEEKQD